MGELVDLKQYRLKKEAEEEIKVQQDIDDLKKELDEIMARIPISHDVDSYPIFSESDSLIAPSEYIYFSTLWPPYDEYHRDRDDVEGVFQDLCFDYENPKWYIDLKLKPLKDREYSED